MAIPLVEKERVPDYHFVKDEVLSNSYEVELRKILLEEARLLGNVEKYKVKIIFETTEGAKMVETTVWDISDTYVELKGGIHIPVNSIKEVLI